MKGKWWLIRLYLLGKCTVNSYDFGVFSSFFVCFSPPLERSVKRAAEGTLKRRCTASSGSSNCLVQVNGNPFHQQAWTGWWFQPIWKICSSNWIMKPQGSGWKFQKYFELPPTLGWILKQKKKKTYAPWDWNIYLYIYQSKLNVGIHIPVPWSIWDCFLPQKNTYQVVQAVTCLFPSWRSPTNCKRVTFSPSQKKSPAELPGTSWSHRNQPVHGSWFGIIQFYIPFYPTWVEPSENLTGRPDEPDLTFWVAKKAVDLTASAKQSKKAEFFYPWITDGLTIGKMINFLALLVFSGDIPSVSGGREFFVDPPSYTP